MTSKIKKPEYIIEKRGIKGSFLSWLKVLLLVYLLICAVSTIGGGFKLAAGERAEDAWEDLTRDTQEFIKKLKEILDKMLTK